MQHLYFKITKNKETRNLLKHPLNLSQKSNLQIIPFQCSKFTGTSIKKTNQEWKETGSLRERERERNKIEHINIP